MALSDELMTEPTPDAPTGDGAPQDQPALGVEATEQPQRELEESLPEEPKPCGIVKEQETPAHNSKSDSEAETEILSGKEDDPKRKSRKAIKLEEAEDSISDAEKSNDKDEQVDGQARLGARQTSLKRKRGAVDPQLSDAQDEPESSKLSSTIASPIIERRTSDEIDSKSGQSESSPPIEDATNQRESKSTKRQHNADKPVQHKRAHIKDSVNGHKRRDTRSATDLDDLVHRSTSPPSRKAHRAQSAQSSTSQPQSVKKRKKTPAPLNVDRRSRPSDHGSDSESGQDTRQTPGPKSGGDIMWRAKVSNKRNMDRSGRTLLARACASGAADEAEKWLKERPEDIDLADYAGNTPLQVACLEGNEDIVKLLLDAGCRTDSKNVDNDTPLIDAVENGHLEVVRLLLDARTDPTQRNARGKEPIELVNLDTDDHEEIRAALMASKKEKDGKRRKSEDHSRQKMSVPRELDASSVTTAGPSPTHGTRSPPLEPGARRRTARSQHTDASLLYVNATPQRLRDAAGKGEMNIVSHILNMRPEADTEAILAAAQGGHDEVLGLMLAIAQPESDPLPLRSSKPGHATPILTAIGRGNIKVLDLLVQQPGFDPTRRAYKNLTYFELAKERQGLEWQEEYELLKDAYDQYRKNGGRRSNNASPNKVRSKRKDKESRKSSPEPSSSPHEVRKVRRPQPHMKDEHDADPKRRPSYQGTAVKQRDRDESRKTPSSVASDHETEVRRSKESKLINRVRSTSPGQAAVQKPRRRLLSGNDVKTDQDTRRKAHLGAGDMERRKSGDSATSHDAPHRRSSDASMSAPPVKKKASSESPRRAKEESNSGKKRLRTSTSPHASRSEVNDMIAKKKRLRVDSHGNAVDQGRERPHHPGPAPPANMVPSPPVSSSPKLSSAPAPTAPVAFMGSATASPPTKSPVNTSPVESHSKSTQNSPVSIIDPALQPSVRQSDVEAKDATGEEADRKKQEEAERQRKDRLEQERLEAEERHQRATAEKQAQLQKEREEVEREAQVGREKEEAAERLAQEERRKEREELEAQARKRKEEENRERRAEQERQRKADQEQRKADQEKRRREAEQLQIEIRLKAQEEEERVRRDALPNGLRRYFELSPEEGRLAKEIKKWLPLRTVTTEDLEPGSHGLVAEERWIANVQAAPLLANKDLELSQYTAWSRRPAISSQQAALWRQLRNSMAQPTGAAYISAIDAHNLERENMPKFLKLKVFWIKLSDFMDIVPRHPHLANTSFTHQDFVLHQFKFGLQPRPRGDGDGDDGLGALGIKEEKRSPTPVTNGSGAMVNGHI